MIFQAGIFVGFHKASFSYRMGDNYYRTFGPQRNNQGLYPISSNMGMTHQDFSDSHGAIGQIIKIQLPILTIEDNQNIEKIILVTDKTIIKKLRDSIKKEDLKVDDFLTVIGSPNSMSQIEARFIRVLPPLPLRDNTLSTSSTNKIQH
jgi:hypothetical protein